MADEKASARTRGLWDGRTSSGMYRSVAAGVAWLSCLQVFVVDLVVQAEWVAPYPVSEGYLSDLFKACGACSPERSGWRRRRSSSAVSSSDSGWAAWNGWLYIRSWSGLRCSASQLWSPASRPQPFGSGREGALPLAAVVNGQASASAER